jgi:hypothetical protein
MAIALENKENVVPPGSPDYPFGAIKDDTGSEDGTPVNEAVYQDFHQFFAKLLNYGGVTANGIRDGIGGVFQYFTALTNTITSLAKGLVINNLTSNTTDQPLSAFQGKVLQQNIDAEVTARAAAITALTNAWQVSTSTSGTTCPIATITAVTRKWNVTLNKVTMSFVIELTVTGSNPDLNVTLALPVNANASVSQYDISSFAIRNLSSNINLIGSMDWIGGSGNQIVLTAVNGVVNFPANNYRIYGQITYEKA